MKIKLVLLLSELISLKNKFQNEAIIHILYKQTLHFEILVKTEETKQQKELVYLRF